MKDFIFGALLVVLVTGLYNNVEQIIPNNVGYYIEMMLPF